MVFTRFSTIHLGSEFHDRCQLEYDWSRIRFLRIKKRLEKRRRQEMVLLNQPMTPEVFQQLQTIWNVMPELQNRLEVAREIKNERRAALQESRHTLTELMNNYNPNRPIILTCIAHLIAVGRMVDWINYNGPWAIGELVAHRMSAAIQALAITMEIHVPNP